MLCFLQKQNIPASHPGIGYWSTATLTRIEWVSVCQMCKCKHLHEYCATVEQEAKLLSPEGKWARLPLMSDTCREWQDTVSISSISGSSLWNTSHTADYFKANHSHALSMPRSCPCLEMLAYACSPHTPQLQSAEPKPSVACQDAKIKCSLWRSNRPWHRDNHHWR